MKMTAQTLVRMFENFVKFIGTRNSHGIWEAQVGLQIGWGPAQTGLTEDMINEVIADPEPNIVHITIKASGSMVDDIVSFRFTYLDDTPVKGQWFQGLLDSPTPDVLNAMSQVMTEGVPVATLKEK